MRDKKERMYELRKSETDLESKILSDVKVK